MTKLKIGILTFTGTTNYGAVLQAYALQKKLESEEAEVEIIRYHNAQVLKNHEPKLVWKRKGFLNKLAAPFQYRVYKKRLDAFNRFEEKYCNFSEICNAETFEQIIKKYDRIVVGSDQVWNLNLTNRDQCFFLKNVGNSYVKCSYAASLGEIYFNHKEAKMYEELLASFSIISVREQESAAHLKDKLKRNDITCDMDPTLLLSEKWKEFISDNIRKKQYIFMYMIPENEKFLESVRTFAKRNSYEIIWQRKGIRVFKGIKIVNSLSPEEFLNHIYFADYVVTGSFHATCFSIMFQKKFFSILSSNLGKNSRITGLLVKLGLTERQIYNDNYTFLEDEIDYQNVCIKLNDLCGKSMKTIYRICEKCEDNHI